jgi:hypothetical protein
MDLYTALDTQTIFLVICCGVGLVLGLYALVMLLMAVPAPRRAHFVRGHAGDVWMPVPREPVPGKAGLYSAPPKGRS